MSTTKAVEHVADVDMENYVISRLVIVQEVVNKDGMDRSVNKKVSTWVLGSVRSV